MEMIFLLPFMTALARFFPSHFRVTFMVISWGMLRAPAVLPPEANPWDSVGCGSDGTGNLREARAE